MLPLAMDFVTPSTSFLTSPWWDDWPPVSEVSDESGSLPWLLCLPGSSACAIPTPKASRPTVPAAPPIVRMSHLLDISILHWGNGALVDCSGLVVDCSFPGSGRVLPGRGGLRGSNRVMGARPEEPQAGPSVRFISVQYGMPTADARPLPFLEIACLELPRAGPPVGIQMPTRQMAYGVG